MKLNATLVGRWAAKAKLWDDRWIPFGSRAASEEELELAGVCLVVVLEPCRDSARKLDEAQARLHGQRQGPLPVYRGDGTQDLILRKTFTQYF